MQEKEDEEKPELIKLTDLAIDWRHDFRDSGERGGWSNGLSRLLALLFGRKADTGKDSLLSPPNPPTAE